jgi:1-acyl-sn-glycerol-3-phosphate acyltransferase
VIAAGMRLVARTLLASYNARVLVEGVENVPPGATIVVARHYHHALDGAALVAALTRPVHIVVGLDWAPNARTRALMEWLCRVARWPIVLRPRGLMLAGASGAYDPAERLGYLRAARRETMRLLGAGALVVVFPEGFPTIDPSSNVQKDDAFLPFDRSFAALASAAARAMRRPVALVPAGFAYAERTRGWDIALRFAQPLRCDERSDPAALAREAETLVRVLSALPPR